MDRKDDHDMNLDHQIKLYEDRISMLEDSIRSCSGDHSEIEMDLDLAYQQVTLLKIRKMMMNA